MLETEPSYYENDVAAPEQLTLSDCLKLLEHEQVEVVVSPADAEYMKELGLDELPAGVAVMGGAARAILLRSRYGRDVPIRDIDLVAIKGLYSETNDTLDALSAEYMADDYTFGHGIKVEQIDAYFVTRDFTLNEILVVDGMIISTAQADADISTHTIRASEYETDPYNGRIGPKLKLKAALLAAVFEEAYGHAVDVTPEAWDMRDFYMALTLNKAFQYGENVTKRFMRRLGYQEEPGNSMYETAIREAVELARATDFEFRGSDIADEIMNYALESNQAFGEETNTTYTAQEQKALELLRQYGRYNHVADEY